MARVAIFSAPKPFIDEHIKIIQRNAIQSWKALGSDVEIWLVGDEEGVGQAAKELGVGYIPEVARNDSGTPRIDSIFNLVREKSQAEYLCYVNADILLFPDLLETVDLVRKKKDKFLMIGRRWDADITEPLQIEPGWGKDFIEKTTHRSKMHKATGSDYFVFPRTIYTNIPPFAVGRAGWDNWMIFHGRVEHMAVIDASSAITVIHQNHDYRHFKDGKVHRHQPESFVNVDLAGGNYTMYTLYDANYQMENRMITKPKLTWWKVVREFSIFPAVTLKCTWLAKILYSMFNRKRVRKDAKKRKEMEATGRLRKA